MGSKQSSQTLGMEASQVIDEIWQNLTTTRNDIRFFLDV